MRSEQKAMHLLPRTCGATVVMGVTLFAIAANAGPVDWHDLADKPTDYLNKEIEVSGYCTKGGTKGDVLGYECATEGPVYIDARQVEPDDAAKKVDDNCGAMDVIERSSFCKVTVKLTPHSFTTSNTIEEGKSVTVFNADKAELSF
jgi:hypothetical protein